MTAVVLAAPGPVVVDPNIVAVHSNATLTAGTNSALPKFFSGAREVSLVVNVKNAPTGSSPTLTFSVQEIDPGDKTTLLGSSVSGTVITGVTTQTITLPVTKSGMVSVSWTVGGSASPTFTGVYATLVHKVGSSVSVYDASGNLLGVSANPLQTLQPDYETSGTVSANGVSVTTTSLSGYSSLSVQVTGTWVGSFIFEVSNTGLSTDWVAMVMKGTNSNNLSTGLTTANGIFRTAIPSLKFFRVRSTAWTSGTANILIRASQGSSNTQLTESLPAGTANIGVTVGAGTSGSPSGGVFSTQVADTVGSLVTFNGSSVSAVVALASQRACQMQLAAGTLAGTLIAQLSFDGGTTYPTQTLFQNQSSGVFSSSVVLTNPNAQTNMGIVLMDGATHARVFVSAFTSGAATCTLRATNDASPQTMMMANDSSGNPMRLLGQSGVPYNAISSPTAANNSLGTAKFVSITPFGELRTFQDPSSLMADKFDSVNGRGNIDATQWTQTTTLGATVGVVSGTLQLNTGTTALAVAELSSVPSFAQEANVFLSWGETVTLPAVAPTNSVWSIGLSTPNAGTVAAPTLNGVGFEITTAGVFRAVIYSNGSVVYSQALTYPTLTNGECRLSLQQRTDSVYFYVNGTDLPVAVASFFAPQIQSLPVRHSIINASPGPGTGAVLGINAVGVGDTGRNNFQLSDGYYHWRKQTVKPVNTRPFANDYAALVTVAGPALGIMGADRAIGGELITMPYVIQSRAEFDAPLANNAVTTTTTGGATAVQSASNGLVLTSAAAAGASQAKVVSNKKVRYKPGREFRMEFSCGFTSSGAANSDILIGFSDESGSLNRLVLGYHNGTFGFHIYSGGTVTSFPQASWNGDPLDGTANSNFTSGFTPVAINLANANAWRIRGVWFGVGPVYLEVKSPDEAWLTVHTFRYPNTAQVPYLQTPNMFPYAEVTKTSSAGAGTLSLFSFCWSGGSVEADVGFEPHEVNSHTQVQQAGAGISTNTTAYTVSTGRQLFIKAMTISIYNTDGTNPGQLNIIDATSGTGTTPLLHAISIPKGSGAGTYASVSLTAPVPIIALTGVRFVAASGTLTWSYSFQGYEKEL